MNEQGLQEVRNPSETLLSGLQHHHSGVAIGMVVEGSRPLLLEVQSLVSRATYSTVQRIATGIDIKRLHMLLALLEKRKGMMFGGQDVFVNLAGGIKVEDRALDLALCVAMSSSLRERPVPHHTGFCSRGRPRRRATSRTTYRCTSKRSAPTWSQRHLPLCLSQRASHLAQRPSSSSDEVHRRGPRGYESELILASFLPSVVACIERDGLEVALCLGGAFKLPEGLHSNAIDKAFWVVDLVASCFFSALGSGLHRERDGLGVALWLGRAFKLPEGLHSNA